MLKKIDIEKLRLGMYITEFCGSWMEHPFWNTKFVLDDLGDLERIRDSGIRELWIDVSKGEDVEGGMSAAEVQARNENEVLAASVEAAGPAARVTASQELMRARKICAAAKQAVESMFKEARMGRSIDTHALAPMVEEIASSVMRHPGALISLARLKTKDDYTYMHSVAVCGLMISLANKLGLDEATTREAGLAGLVHDLGKAVIPLSVLNKPDKLTDDEFRVIRGHPGAGHAMLLEGGGAGEIALDVVLHHHEKIDGSGYPHKLKGEQISLFSKMGAVCDVYDAITSNRPYKAGWDPSEALRKMSEWSGHFDTGIFHSFIKCVGIYPLGSLVRLESGLLGVVTETRPDALLKPVVKAFYCTRRRQRFIPRMIDLGKPHARDRIAAWESRDKWKFPDIDEMWTDNRLAVPA